MTDKDTAYCLGYALAGISQAIRKFEAGKAEEAHRGLEDTLAEIAQIRKVPECLTTK